MTPEALIKELRALDSNAIVDRLKRIKAEEKALMFLQKTRLRASNMGRIKA